MTNKQYQKFIPICEGIISSGGFKFIKEYSNVKNAFNLAKYHFKVPKSNFENGYLEDSVCIKTIFCENENKVMTYAIRTKKNYTLRDWMVIELSNTACLSLEKTKNILNSIY
ncbi:MAG: hypothetical protein J0L47_06690 [Flavobacteriales bacterium]|jgi:hypothetical protein|nr:hypothetical protein [Flavobacteriales bacterium]MCA0391976.1 hypothetical protein [Bacteroidota bacterium]